MPGEKGEHGETRNALKGEKGAMGDPGPAYNPPIWLNATIDIKGEKGPQGDDGPNGEQGQIGDSGVPGYAGPAGIKGIAGDVGDQGPFVSEKLNYSYEFKFFFWIKARY